MNGMIRRLSAQRAAVAMLLAMLAGMAAGAQAAEAEAPHLLHAMFQDHAVLQRDAPIRVWGAAEPGADVHVALAGRAAKARAGADGRWEARLPALKAGGPHVLSATSGTRRQAVQDVLVGDVWLCSGQSNMELQVWRSLDARAEIANASADRIRLLTVPQTGSATPLESFATPTRWQTVTPETLRDFSAACYYFARELQKAVDVPMGLINAAWGGSRIQAWTSSSALRGEGYGNELDVLDLYARDQVAGTAGWGEVWQRWWSARSGTPSGDAPWQPDAPPTGWRAAPASLGAWERWGVPALADFNGMVWYRTTVTLTAAQAARQAVLALGPADEIDMTWINGRAVGSTYGAGGDREYAVPDGLLHEGRNVVVVNVLDTYREGGLAGPASRHALRFADGSAATLDSAWTYRVVPPVANEAPPRAPWQTAAGLSTLYNGMIAPLGRYGLRGALWYQGESNTFEAVRYAALLRALRNDWRARFGDDLPLLLVQLAGYGVPVSRPAESDWAALREAQRQVAQEDPRTGLVVAIDIGDHYDIHPPNKQEVGRRLAQAARHVVYGERVAASGPAVRAVRRQGDAVVVEFDDVTGVLVAYGAESPVGFELCGTQAGSCRYASATLSGRQATLRADGSHDVARLRYCWADGPVCTLFDGAGQPAGPFEMLIPSTHDGEQAR